MLPARCELWGYPGVGKSTVARQLKQQFGVQVPPLQPLRGGLAARARRLSSQLSAPWLWTAHLPPASPLKTRKRRLHNLLDRHSATLAECEGSCVLEEGVLHEIWRLLYAHPEQIGEDWWKPLVERAAPVVMLLEISPERALERIRSKPKHGPINLELLEDPLGERWIKAVDAYVAVRRAIAASGKNRLVILDANHADSTEICKRIVAILKPGPMIDRPPSGGISVG